MVFLALEADARLSSTVELTLGAEQQLIIQLKGPPHSLAQAFAALDEVLAVRFRTWPTPWTPRDLAVVIGGGDGGGGVRHDDGRPSLGGAAVAVVVVVVIIIIILLSFFSPRSPLFEGGGGDDGGGDERQGDDDEEEVRSVGWARLSEFPPLERVLI